MIICDYLLIIMIFSSLILHKVQAVATYCAVSTTYHYSGVHFFYNTYE